MTTVAGAGFWPMLGREQEIAAVTAALRRGEAGVVLIGPAGAGKTRLATEVLALTAGRGVRAVRAVASRAAATIPLGAFAPLLPVALPTSGEIRADVLHAAADAIVEAAGDGALLVVDDAHLLDDASATVLHQLASLRRITILATIRSGEQVPDPVVALWKDSLAHRFQVQHLDRETVEQLLATALEGRIDSAATSDLFRASQGNPLLLRELVLGALEAETLVHQDGMWQLQQVPAEHPRLTELVENRLTDLDDDERDLLEIIAQGESLAPAILEHVAGASLDRLEQLERRGLIEVASDGRRTEVRLAHPLYGEVVRRKLSRLRVMGINRGLADAVESFGAKRRDDLFRVAVWRLDGGGAVQPDLMLDAARRAHFTFDRVLAERLARASYEAGGGVPAGLMLAEIVSSVGRHRDCDALLSELLPAATDDAERAQVVFFRARTLFWGLGRHDEAIAILAAAMGITPPGALRDEMSSFRGTIDALAGYPLRAIEGTAELLASDDGRPVVLAAIASANALTICGQTEQALAVARRGHAAHLRLGHQQMLAKPWIHECAMVMAYAEAGPLAEAVSLAETGYRESLERRETVARAWFAMLLARAQLIAGLAPEAARWFAEGAALFRSVNLDGQRRWCLAGRTIAAAYVGDAAGAKEAADELRELDGNPMTMMEADVNRAFAWQAHVAGEPERARTILRDAATEAVERGAFALAIDVLHDLARLGDADHAAPRVAALVDHVDAGLAHVRAAYVEGVRASDGEALDDVAARFEALGSPLYAAEASAEAAAAHRRTGDRRRAETAERNAARLSTRCDTVRTPPLTGVGPVVPLTARQRDVALLAAQGLASKQIAQRLNVSARTVDNHLQQVFQKLGVANRADLADVLNLSPELLGD